MPICPNCSSAAVDNYCAQCGQRRHTAHSLRDFVRSVADDQIGVDAKIPRTLRALFLKPGFLTTEYMAGRIARYIPPFRLYLLASVVFFVLLSFMSVRQDWGVWPAGRSKRVFARVRIRQLLRTPLRRRDGTGMKVGVSFERRPRIKDVKVNMGWKRLDDKIEQNTLALGQLPPDVATTPHHERNHRRVAQSYVSAAAGIRAALETAPRTT